MRIWNPALAATACAAALIAPAAHAQLAPTVPAPPAALEENAEAEKPAETKAEGEKAAPTAAALDPKETPIYIQPRLFIKRGNFDAIALKEPERLNAELTITHRAIGRFIKHEDATEFVPADKIPMVPGGGFGWVICTDGILDLIQVAESFTLPAGNETWSVDSDATTISEDGLTATTRSKRDLWKWVFNSWVFEKGDPTGAHQFVIRHGDIVLGDFSFEVVAPEEKPAP